MKWQNSEQMKPNWLEDADLNSDLWPSSPVSSEHFLFDSWRWMILMMPEWWRHKAKISKVFSPASTNTETESKGVELLSAIGLKSKKSDKLWAMSLITLSSATETKLAALWGLSGCDDCRCRDAVIYRLFPAVCHWQTEKAFEKLFKLTNKLPRLIGLCATT